MIDIPERQKNRSRRYLVAKYAPDRMRQEYRNIGVILWFEGQVNAKFLPWESARKFVNSKDTYERWIKYWEKLLSSEEISVRSDHIAKRDDAQYLDVLKKTQQGNYALVEGGDIYKVESLSQATDFLFRRLISGSEIHNATLVLKEKIPSKMAMQRLSKEAFEDIGIWGRSDFHKGKGGYKVQCDLHDVTGVPVTVHYALGNGGLDAVFHRVNLLEESDWESAVTKLDAIKRSQGLAKNRCAALLSSAASVASKSERTISRNINIIKKIAMVADLSKPTEAKNVLSQVAGI